MIAIIALAVMALTAAVAAQQPEVLVLGDFETDTWPGLERSAEQARQGEFSGKWANLPARTSIRVPDIPQDWSGYDRLMFWLWSEKANQQRLTIVCDSDNPDNPDGWDYFFYHFTVNWEGWRFFDLRLGEDIRPTRRPIGWHHIKYFSINASGWENRPLPDTVLYFDDVKLVSARALLHVETRSVEPTAGPPWTVRHELRVTNPSEREQRFHLHAEGPVEAGLFALRMEGIGQEHVVGARETAMFPVALELLGAPGEHEPLTRAEFTFEVQPTAADMPVRVVRVGAAVPMPRRERPLLFGDAALFERAEQRAREHDWAKAQLDAIIRAADAAVEAELDVPDEPGQWSHHYVCKECGARLRHENGRHVCQRCEEVYTGWPYDQVVIAGIHGRNWSNVRTLGLAYAFTGEEKYAGRAREILLAYADKYLSYPLHDVRGGEGRSGARVFAQTLDEAVSIIGVAWGYDLIHDSPLLSDEDRQAIEDRFLRQVVETIRRHDAGISNWQSWHNAGIAAIGFALQDEDIASLAINGKSGLRFQLDNSVLADGFWYEGAVAYHYYALDALRWTVEAAYRADIDLHGHPNYRALFDAPLHYVFPDLNFPAVNDSDLFSIRGQHRLYELAYARYEDPQYVVVAQHGNRRSLEALLWGADDLPPAPPVDFDSRDFSGVGIAVLRQGAGEEQTYLHLKYGPHGGGHGHPDKLGIILFALGKRLAPDAGRLAYGAPLHGQWYVQTFAHNVVCVDGRSQRPTEGRLSLFHSQPGLAVAQAETDDAYPGVLMRRTVAVTEDYLIDVFDVTSDEERTYDWVYHNFGDLRPGLPTSPREEPLGEAHGYQHMRDITQATTAETWSADFAQEGANVRLTMLGASDTEVYFGTGWVNNPPEPCPMLVARRQGQATRFISVIEPHRDGPVVTSLRAAPVAGGDALVLEIGRGEDRDVFLLAEEGGIERRFAGLSTTARVFFARIVEGEVQEVHHVE